MQARSNAARSSAVVSSRNRKRIEEKNRSGRFVAAQRCSAQSPSRCRLKRRVRNAACRQAAATECRLRLVPPQAKATAVCAKTANVPTQMSQRICRRAVQRQRYAGDHRTPVAHRPAPGEAQRIASAGRQKAAGVRETLQQRAVGVGRRVAVRPQIVA